MNLPSTDSEPLRPRYGAEFKAGAVRLWKTSRRSAASVAKDLGISSATLYLWGREARLVGAGRVNGSSARLFRELEEEISRLHVETEKLRQLREVLESALAVRSVPRKGRSHHFTKRMVKG